MTPNMIPEMTLDVPGWLTACVHAWKKRMHLADWTVHIRLELCLNNDPDCRAMCQQEPDLNVISLAFRADIEDTPEWHRTVIHELVHARHARIDHMSVETETTVTVSLPLGLLVKALSLVQPTVGSEKIDRHGVLIEASEGKVLFSTSDVERSIQVTVPAECRGEEKILVPFSIFYNVTKNLPGDDADPVTLFIDLEYFRISIQAARNKSTIHCLDPKRFYGIDFVDPSHSVTVPTGRFTEAIGEVMHAIKDEGKEPMSPLDGACLTFSNQKIHLYGANGFCLAFAWVDLPVDIPALPDGKFIIPKKSMGILASLLKRNKEVEIIAMEHEMMAFRFEDCLFQTRLVSGDFPLASARKILRDALTEQYDIDFKVETKDFMRAIKVAAAFVDDNRPGLIVEVKEDSILVQSRRKEGEDSGSGECPGTLQQKEQPGENITLVSNSAKTHINARYLEAAVDLPGAKLVTLALFGGEPTRPLYILTPGSVQVIMPLTM